jgi:hypothetical protein
MERNDAGNTDFLISISPFHVTVKSTKNDNESHEDTTRFDWSYGLILREFSPGSGKLFFGRVLHISSSGFLFLFSAGEETKQDTCRTGTGGWYLDTQDVRMQFLFLALLLAVDSFEFHVLGLFLGLARYECNCMDLAFHDSCSHRYSFASYS